MGTIDDKIDTSTITVATQNHEIDFTELAKTDLVYIGTDTANREISIANAGTEYTTINCDFDDQGENEYSYNLNLSGNIHVQSKFSNYTKGQINIIYEDDSNDINLNGDPELHIPLVATGSKAGSLMLFNLTIYSNIDIGDNITLTFGGRGGTLKSGAILGVFKYFKELIFIKPWVYWGFKLQDYRPGFFLK